MSDYSTVNNVKLECGRWIVTECGGNQPLHIDCVANRIQKMVRQKSIQRSTHTNMFTSTSSSYVGHAKHSTHRMADDTTNWISNLFLFTIHPKKIYSISFTAIAKEIYSHIRTHTHIERCVVQFSAIHISHRPSQTIMYAKVVVVVNKWMFEANDIDIDACVAFEFDNSSQSIERESTGINISHRLKWIWNSFQSNIVYFFRFLLFVLPYAHTHIDTLRARRLDMLTERKRKTNARSNGISISIS